TRSASSSSLRTRSNPTGEGCGAAACRCGVVKGVEMDEANVLTAVLPSLGSVHGLRVTCVQRGAGGRTEAGGGCPPLWEGKRPCNGRWFFACVRLSRVARRAGWLGSRHLTRTAFTLRFHTHP